ncbi:Flagellar biosynthesis protein, FliO [Botrimarina colliarenosi]|uniref:Flagellar biosynthesis protein, FliO n=1 Tax=Botrimarina colliarenosi TaxID=2528001 RepID=A0A5C6AM17_9BACT|nr:flagellar biosynthetic protein FliO [Botrimarina colliarenosi]TWU00319.1 Flagellar biosynthesis protein, FliO [Botrimarina colliarenosi]
MPTRCCPPLLALAALVASTSASAGDNDVLVPADAYERMRPAGASSAGPQGMRRIDTHVEPAAFHALGMGSPLAPPPSTPSPSTLSLVSPSEAPRREDTDVPEPRQFDPFEEALFATASKPSDPATPSVDETAQPETPLTNPAPLAASNAKEPVATPAPPAKTPSNPSAEAPAPSDRSSRLLGSSLAPKDARPTSDGRLANPLQSMLDWRPSSQTLTATGAGLAIAVGLLISFVWLLRCLAPKSSRPLPREVVEVLGRAPLGGKQVTQLVRIGQKLVLIAVSPDGMETLTEITDPEEVARLVAACDAQSGRGSTAEFDAFLRQMEGERTRPGFLDDRQESRGDSLGFADGAFDPRSLAAAYANTPGGRGDG